MAIALQTFDAVRIRDSHAVFRPEIEGDPWIVFHGTSNLNAVRIEAEGFNPAVATKRLSLEALASVFESMRWAGLGRGGFEILKPFSLGYDSTRGTTFFAESSVRSSLYASRDFAGGEKLRAIRRAFTDLDTYLHDSRTREEHLAALARKFHRLQQLNAHPAELEKVRPVAVDLARLKSEIGSLRPLRQLAEGALEAHRHGVIYAVKLRKEDVPNVSWNPAMGVESSKAIPACRIIAKVHLPIDFEAPPRECAIDRLGQGLLAALRQP